MNTASPPRAPGSTASGPGQLGLSDAARSFGANEEPGPAESEDDIPHDEANATDAARHVLGVASSPAGPTRQGAETYTPPGSTYHPPSSDEVGPVESEDDIPREDNDTPRE